MTILLQKHLLHSSSSLSLTMCGRQSRQEPWSTGSVRRLMLLRSWVRILGSSMDILDGHVSHILAVKIVMFV